jgi:hypothetical protein
MTITKMQTRICESINSDECIVSKPETDISTLVSELVCTTTPGLDNRILEVRSRIISDLSLVMYRDIVLPEFGKDYLLSRGLPIKGIYDLLVQLATYYFYGTNFPTWEAVSMSHYHRGRPDIVQVVSPIIASFCSSADNEDIPLATRFQSLLEAAKDHNKTIKEALAGQCYQRTFLALQMAIEDNEETPAFFKNPAFVDSLEPDLMFSNTDGLSPESVFVMGDPNRFWMTYYVMDNW